MLGPGSFCRPVGLIEQDSQLVAVGEASQGIGGGQALKLILCHFSVRDVTHGDAYATQ